MTRRPRPRKPRGASRVGEQFEVHIGPVAHGGHCVARVPTSSAAPDETRVVFVRHALPGERVVVEITEGTEGDSFWRGDAVSVVSASPDRVEAPCRFAGPGLCGGCDFQHVALDRQRALKADVVREQLSRLAGLDIDVVVEPVPNPLVEPSRDHGLHWRTRQRFVELPDGRRGMLKHRSHEVVEIDECLIAAPRSGVGPVESLVELVETTHGTHSFSLARNGFWQVHPGAPAVLVDTVLDLLRPAPGEHALDLYAGVGLFARFLLDAVGETGRVVAIEGGQSASARSVRNCPGVEASCGDVERVLAGGFDEPFDLVVLDPPREGAKRKVVAQVVARAPRAVVYVACDPAALARDVATFAEHGYLLEELRAFDLFPMTHHVECVALLTKTGSDLR